MTITFKRASKTQARLRLALIGPAGSGKTMTALQIATTLGGPVAVMDTEHGSASKYASLFEFDSFDPSSFHPQVYIDAIHAAEDNGYRVLIIDSLSHAWSGKDGALELVDRAAKRNQGGNNFSAWRDVTPLHNALVEAMIGSSIHIIATIRAKTDYVQEKNEQGRTVIRKVGLQPVQRDGLEYEFDVVGDLTQDNDLIIGKTRCPDLSGKAFNRNGKQVAAILSAWLSDGAPAPTPEPANCAPLPTNGNGKKPPTRDGMIKRIADLTDEANRIKLPVLLPKPLDEMSDSELIAFGKSLSLSVEQAKAQADMDELFPPDAPRRGMKEEALPL